MWGLRDGLATKSGSCRGPRFSIQYSALQYLVLSTHSCLELQVQEIRHPLLASVGICIYTVHIHTLKQTHLYINTSFLYLCVCAHVHVCVSMHTTVYVYNGTHVEDKEQPGIKSHHLSYLNQGGFLVTAK